MTELIDNNRFNKLGFNGEMGQLTYLKDSGCAHNIIFHNPTDFYSWQRDIGHGVDLVCDSDSKTVHYWIEESWADHDYYYRTAWFYESRLPRFRDVPETDEHNKRVILTNKPKNFEGLSWLLSKLSILLLSIDELIQLLHDCPNHYYSTTTTNNTTSCRVVDDRQLIDDPNHEAWLEELIDRAIKLGS